MKRTAASRWLILAVLGAAVLLLPLGNPAAAGAQTPHCPCCQMAGHGMLPCCPCCPQHGKAGQDGPCAGSHSLICHCGVGSPAFLTASTFTPCAWRVFPFLPARATVATKAFPPHIFHPPQLSALAL